MLSYVAGLILWARACDYGRRDIYWRLYIDWIAPMSPATPALRKTNVAAWTREAPSETGYVRPRRDHNRHVDL